MSSKRSMPIVIISLISCLGLLGCGGSGGGGGSSGDVDDLTIVSVEVGGSPASYVAEAFPVHGTQPAPVDLGSYVLPEHNLILLNVRTEPGTTELLVGTLSDANGYFLQDVHVGDFPQLGPEVEGHTIAITADRIPESITGLMVASRSASGLTLAIEYQLSVPEDGIGACELPVFWENVRLSGTWSKIDGSSWSYFPDTMTLHPSYFGGGLWSGGDLRLAYGVAVEPEGCNPDDAVLLTDPRNPNDPYDDVLIVTLNYRWLHNSLVEFTNWNREALYARTSPPPLERLPDGSIVVPYMNGLPREAALMVLEQFDLVAGTITYEETGRIPNDSVLSHEPRGGTVVPNGSTVNLHVSIRPEVDVQITPLDRLPMGPVAAQDLTVTVTPDPAPGEYVLVYIETLTGDGWATFVDGSDTKRIGGTSTLKVMGIENSSVKDNLRVTAVYGFESGVSDVFSVRTWPKSFGQPIAYPNHCEKNRANPGVLLMAYSVESESGRREDMYGNIIGEEVEYGNDDSCSDPGTYCLPSPPYTDGDLPNPTIIELDIGSEALISDPPIFWDTHKVPLLDACADQRDGFVAPYAEHVLIGIQRYYFRDPVLDRTIDLMGPLYIRRNVFNDVGVWKYRIEKTGPDHQDANAEVVLR